MHIHFSSSIDLYNYLSILSFYTRVNHMKKLIGILSAVLLLSQITASAQVAVQFKVATLNVDGLPQKILFIQTNPDGPGADGSSRIGKYLNQKGYDIVCLQEDFNFHGIIEPWLEDDYQLDTWSGPVGTDVPGKSIDYMHLQNLRFDCDGLGTIWKNNITLTNSERVSWDASFGKFSHANDEMVTKGFRRYELTMPFGIDIILYNMHMDAGDDPDEMAGNDTKDREARQSQWLQLKEDVLAHLNDRPILIMGDLNSYYCRDLIQRNFINGISDTGIGTASDVYVELMKDGIYPEAIDGIVYRDEEDKLYDGQGNTLEPEELDKIIYINPSEGTQIKPVAYQVDKEGYTYNGKPLGDHYPVIATFEVMVKNYTGIESLVPTDTDEPSYYNLSGQRVYQPANGLFIEKSGKNTTKRIIK